MATDKMIEELVAAGVRISDYHAGSHKTVCPQCSHTRRNKKDPCLSVTVLNEGYAIYNCHHCGWGGGAGKEYKQERAEKKQYTKPEPLPAKAQELPEKVRKYFADRAIPEETMKAFKVSHQTVRGGGEILFPYYFEGELVNIKHRTGDKRFRMEKDAQLIFYNLDAAVGQKEIIIVEGEFDVLALHACGIKNVISVPNGSPFKDEEALEKARSNEHSTKLEYLSHAAEIIERADRIILAGDMDDQGKLLTSELARRIGIGKCYQVKWPFKDANDTLMKLGEDVVCDCIREASPMPVKGLYRVSDFQADLLEFYHNGVSGMLSTGWENVDAHYTVMPGEFTVVTGLPNNGKSEWLDCLTLNLAREHNWKIALFSAENPKERHVAKLAEKIIGKPIDPKKKNRMTEDELMQGSAWVDEHYRFIVSSLEDDLPTVDWILERARSAILRDGINGLVIDPWNEIEHQRPQGMMETEYVSKTLARLKRFAILNGIHLWLVAHPAKLPKDKKGKRLPPDLGDISGSQNFENKCDCGIVIHRDESDEDKYRTIVMVKKVRFKEVGQRGIAKLNYNRIVGTYSTPSEEKTYSEEPSPQHSMPLEGEGLDDIPF